MHDMPRRSGAQHGSEFLAQLCRSLEVPVGTQIVGKRPIQRPRHMTTNAIQRLHIAAEARCGACIQHLLRCRIEQLRVIEQHLTRVIVQRD